VINQLKGDWKIKKQDLIPLFNKVKELEQKFGQVDYEWIKRNENKEADLLSAKALGLNLKNRDEKRVHLQVGSSYEFIFDDDEKIEMVKDKRYNRDVKKYYILSAEENGKNISGTYFETGARKLIELLNFYAPLKDKKFRIIPTIAQNWTDYMVEEIYE
jgi:hypothetical protein